MIPCRNTQRTLACHTAAISGALAQLDAQFKKEAAPTVLVISIAPHFDDTCRNKLWKASPKKKPFYQNLPGYQRSEARRWRR